jgi:membrane-bound lytic murein transglycosylase A
MRRRLLVAASALLLAACAQRLAAPKPQIGPPTTLPPPAAVRPPPPKTPEAPETPPPATPVPGGFAGLPGWAHEDHRAALGAVRAACQPPADPTGVCLRLQWLQDPTESQAREFLERNFRPVLLGDSGLLTGYYTPVYEARREPDAEFSEPVRPPPTHAPTGGVRADRAAIARWPADDALAWMRPEDLFFLQIQGSGVLVFPDEARLRAVFAAANDEPFTGIATPMRTRGLLGQNTSGDSIHAWLAQNRGPAAQAVMDLDRRYVFFRLQPDDGAPPAGAAGVRLIPGRALAVDPASHRMGELLWIDAGAPSLPEAFATYRRVAVALDIGSAIKGPARADLYLGEGDAAGLEAGRIRHILRLYRLDPIGPTTP